MEIITTYTYNRINSKDDNAVYHPKTIIPAEQRLNAGATEVI